MRSILDGACVLDGELVVFDDNGVPDFDALKRGVMATFVVFDVLKAGRRTVIQRSLAERQRILAAISPTVGDGLILSRSWPGAGTELFREADKRGFEGIVLKDLRSPYVCGARSDRWIKVRTARGNAAVRARMENARRSA